MAVLKTQLKYEFDYSSKYYQFICTQGNTIQFNPSAHLYRPADPGVTLHYSLGSPDNNKASFSAQVTSDTVNEAGVVRLNNMQYHYMCLSYRYQKRSLNYT